MSSYSIRDLERISNQKAHTIRVWEQRYGLLTPERTNTNIRNYDDDQLKKLLNVCTLLKRGMKISRISKLTKSEIDAEIDKVIAETAGSDQDYQALIEQALVAISHYDIRKFDQLFSESVAHSGMRATYERMLYPLLVRMGLMWTKDDILPAQEHFLSNLIRQKVFTAIDALPLPEQSRQTWILFLNEEEDHEIGLLFAYFMIRQAGQHVIYLGARVPYENLGHVVRTANATHFYSFFIRNTPPEHSERLLENLRKDYPEMCICISGGGGEFQKFAADQKLTLIESIDSLTEIINPHA